jgi:hypothetical protein
LVIVCLIHKTFTMKKLTALFRIIMAVALVLNLNDGFAKIWRVNNNGGVAADFTTLQAAHNGAASGDTIHLEGSPDSYGGLTCSKKLVIIGPGFFLGENPNTQAVALPAYVGGISFNVGSEGSVIMGCDFNGSAVNIFCNDIVIKRNKFSQRNGATLDYYMGQINIYYQSNNSNLSVNNVIISQNFGCEISNTSRAANGVLVSNNYLGFNGYGGDGTTSTGVNMHGNTVAIFQNNIFRRGKVVAYNSNFTNNIMVAGTFEGSGNLLANNIGAGTQFGNANGNQQNVDMATVFLGGGSGISSDGAWKLKAGSPAIGAGFGSTAGNVIDCGMYGGAFPYVLSGMPPIPSVYFFENQPVGSNADPIDVNIKVKSNN